MGKTDQMVKTVRQKKLENVDIQVFFEINSGIFAHFLHS